MKRVLLTLAVLAVCAFVTQRVFAQANVASQQVTLSVNQLALLNVSGDPGALVISAGSFLSDDLTGVSNASTNYSILHNGAATSKITAGIDQGVRSSTSLYVRLNSNKGASAGEVNISNAVSAVDVVNNIGRGADNAKTITYRFEANAAAGYGSETRTVTFTLVSP